jgi:hypothetical protein
LKFEQEFVLVSCYVYSSNLVVVQTDGVKYKIGQQHGWAIWELCNIRRSLQNSCPSTRRVKSSFFRQQQQMEFPRGKKMADGQKRMCKNKNARILKVKMKIFYLFNFVHFIEFLIFIFHNSFACF